MYSIYVQHDRTKYNIAIYTFFFPATSPALAKCCMH